MLPPGLSDINDKHPMGITRMPQQCMKISGSQGRTVHELIMNRESGKRLNIFAGNIAPILTVEQEYPPTQQGK